MLNRGKRFLVGAAATAILVSGCGTIGAPNAAVQSPSSGEPKQVTAAEAVGEGVPASSPKAVVGAVYDTFYLHGPGLWFDYDTVKVTDGTKWMGDIKTAVGSKVGGERGVWGFKDQFLVDKQVNSKAVADWWNARVPASNVVTRIANERPKELAFAACGTLKVAGAQAPICLGKPVLTFDTKWYLGGVGEGWYRWARNPAFMCNEAIGACIRFDNKDSAYGNFEVRATGCGSGEAPPLSSLQLGCVSPDTILEARTAIADNCTKGRECAFVGFNNGAASALNVSANGRWSVPEVPIPAFPSMRFCGAGVTAKHGEVVDRFNFDGTGKSSMSWVLLRSTDRRDDTRIEATWKTRWSPSGDCAAPDTQLATHALNWDPRAKGSTAPEQSCDGVSARTTAAGRPTTVECEFVSSFIQGEGDPGSVGWLGFAAETSQSISESILANVFKTEFGTDYSSSIKAIWQAVWGLIRSGDKVLITTIGLYAGRRT